VTYRTSPEASALQWLPPELTAGGQYPYLFSQCQAIHARSVIPCQDTPRARFAFDARLIVPQPLTAVMAAAPGRVEPGPQDDTRVFSFSMPQSVPPYLFALAVGNLASRDLGPRSRVYTEPEMLEASAYEFAEVDGMLGAAEQIFGPYLWDRFDFLVMPPSFPYGGMENPRLTFLTPTLLAGDRSLVNVLAHELAHSWTGNLVTNANQDHFWLNEGFTVWAERRILERLSGTEAMSLAAAIGRYGLQEAMAQFGTDSSLTKLETDTAGADPDAVYSLVPYEKGFLLVALLEQTAGRERFDDFVKRYIEEFQFTSITTAEFEAFLARELPGVAEQVRAHEWIHEPGLPDNAPEFPSTRLAYLKGLAAGWQNGQRPDPKLARDWSAEEWLVYLQALPRMMPTEECAWLDKTFALTEQKNAEIVFNWLVIATNSAYEPALARVRTFLGEVGRMKYLKPLYKVLHAREQTRELANQMYAEHASRYHPIARAGIERILHAA
jgi:aminopeptidase N